jgi:hypothetical protein
MQDKLNRYARNVTSQHGEDGILAYVCEVLSDRLIRVACEFGAWDGVFASNVYDLWHNRGWMAVLIEGDPEKYVKLQATTQGFGVKAFRQFVTARGHDSLDELFRRERLDPGIGVLSIDIDSFDYHVWKHLTHVDPQVVVIEFNQHIAPHLDYYDPDGEVYLKCSAKALERLGAEKGYRLVCCTKVNAIFVRRDLFDPAKFPDKPVEWLFDYSELKPQVIFTGEGGNMYPVFSRKARAGMKFWWRLYYWLSAMPKRRRHFRPPSRAVVEQIRRMGMDV